MYSCTCFLVCVCTRLFADLLASRMQITWRLSDDPVAPDCPADQADPVFRRQARCKIFLGFTSNLMSAGTREVIRYLCQHKMVDVVVTTAGASPVNKISRRAWFTHSTFPHNNKALPHNNKAFELEVQVKFNNA